MEVKIKITKIKNKFIYGDLLENKKAKQLVVFLSGLSGSREQPLFKNSTKFFFKNGFSTIRFNFCNDSDDELQKSKALKIENMTMSVYTSELKNILDYFGKKYTRVILVGHSFGAIVSILFLKKYKKFRKNTELILWEPSLLPWKKKWVEKDFYFDKTKQLYYEKQTKDLINKTLYKEFISLENTAKTFQSLNKNVCIIAVKNIGEKNARKYFSKTRNKKTSKLIIMKKGGHSFKNKEVQKKLFKETISYLKINDNSQ